MDPSLVNPEYINSFESWLTFQAPFTLAPADLFDYNQLLSLLHSKLKSMRPDRSNIKILHALLLSLLAMAANTFREANNADRDGFRPFEIAMHFKKLLNQNFTKHKLPSAYAEILNISEPYLNGCVKKLTGLTASFWIKQEILIAAKRMLYFTDLNVKQIADNLGYENYSYFCRFFRNETGGCLHLYSVKCLENLLYSLALGNNAATNFTCCN